MGPVIAILWLTPANYDRAVVLSEDGMPATYEAWREKIGKLEAGLPAGVTIKRIEADPQEVAKWCRSNGHRVDTKGRGAFAAAHAYRNMQN